MSKIVILMKVEDEGGEPVWSAMSEVDSGEVDAKIKNLMQEHSIPKEDIAVVHVIQGDLMGVGGSDEEDV
jgi:hypothetical protein